MLGGVARLLFDSGPCLVVLGTFLLLAVVLVLPPPVVLGYVVPPSPILLHPSADPRPIGWSY